MRRTESRGYRRSPRTRSRREEHDEQVTVVQWLEAKRYGCFSVPNEGKRSYATANFLRSAGLRTGAPDLVVIARAADGRPVCVEMKRSGETTSDEQDEMHRRMRSAGWVVIVAQGADEAIAELSKVMPRV